MVWVGALLGLRWGEVAGLRVRDLDLSGRTLSVTEIVTRDERGRSVAGPPKSQAGTRTLSMPEELAHVLSEHFGRLGLTARDPDAYVFTTPTGKAWGYSNWRKQCWLPARTQAGLAGIGFHDLRRTAATYLVAGNVDLKTAQTRLGHSDPRLTLAVYAQATPEADRAAAEAVGLRFSDAMRRRPRDARGMNRLTHKQRVQCTHSDLRLWSGCPDLNRGPLRPERSALTKLRHSPSWGSGGNTDPDLRDATRPPPTGCPQLSDRSFRESMAGRGTAPPVAPRGAPGEAGPGTAG